MEDNMQWLWLLAGIGTVLVAVVIYLWSIRARFQEEPRKRRNRTGQQKEPRLGEPAAQALDGDVEAHHFGDLGIITPDHHLADKALVDIEIYPVNREPHAVRSPFDEFSPQMDTDQPTGGEASHQAHHQASHEAAHEARHEAGHEAAYKARHEVGHPPDDFKMDREDKIPSPASLLLRPAGEPLPATTLPPPADMTIVLTVMAQPRQFFKGSAIQEVAEKAGFQLGSSGLFERFPDTSTSGELAVFSMGHLRKPGLFEPQTMVSLTTSGLLLFMRLPGPMSSANALNLLVITADELARNLNGMICDERRSKITNRVLLDLRNKVTDWEDRRIKFE